MISLFSKHILYCLFSPSNVPDGSILIKKKDEPIDFDFGSKSQNKLKQIFSKLSQCKIEYAIETTYITDKSNSEAIEYLVIKCPIFPYDNHRPIVDSTGAGDAFIGTIMRVVMILYFHSFPDRNFYIYYQSF